MHATVEAKQHAESLGAMNAQLRAESAPAPVVPVTNMNVGGARTSSAAVATLANAAAQPHDSSKARSMLVPQCVATMFAHPASSSMLQWPNLTALPTQPQSVAQILLMHVPYSVGILTASAAPHACVAAADSALQDVAFTIGVTLRAALTGVITARAVLEQLIAALPAAVTAASRERRRTCLLYTSDAADE